MKTLIMWVLVGVNAVLLALFFSSALRDNTAKAQVSAMAGRPGEYILCPGAITGIGSEIVYVVDTLNGQMSGIVYNSNDVRLDVMVPEDLNRIFQAGSGPQPGGAAVPAGGTRR